MINNLASKHGFFSSLIHDIEVEAKKSEIAANTACGRVNHIR